MASALVDVTVVANQLVITFRVCVCPAERRLQRSTRGREGQNPGTCSHPRSLTH